MNIPENVWTSKSGNDFLALYSANGQLLGYIDQNGVPQGSLAAGTNGGGSLTATVTLTNVQLLSLSTVPVVLISAPGAGLYIMPSFISFQLNVGTTPFQIANSGNGSTYIYWSLVGEGSVGENSVSVISDNSNAGIDYTNSASQLYWTATFLNTSTGGSMPFANITNSPLVIAMEDALSVGNGNMKISIRYSVLTA